MKYLYGLAILSCLVLWSSCRNDFETVASSGELSFSKDTVYLDTIFSQIGSSTYNLKVYNRSNKDISIPNVGLALGEASHYRLNVDGVPGKVFQDVQILAKDSIFIFIETTLDINNLPGNANDFLYTDQILFDSGANQQKVELVTLVKDAVFLYPEKYPDGTFESLNLGPGPDGKDVLLKGFFLDDNELTFTNEKPYVIYGFAAVPGNKTLMVEAGARVHFHAESGILVANDGSIRAIGEPSADPKLLEKEIIFQGDRLEPAFANIPGQWGFIWLTSGSKNNEFRHTTIKNGIVGIMLHDSPLTLSNVQIYNNTNSGLLARTGSVYGENVVINNSGQSSLKIEFGGSYTFNHCTFANYWTDGFRNAATVSLDNSLDLGDDGVFVFDLVQADFTNCIIYGSDRMELSLYQHTGADFNFNFKNSLLRFDDTTGQFMDNPLYDFSNPILYNNVVFNLDPVFQNTGKNNFNIEKDTSGAENIGITPTTPPVPIDLNGTLRGNPSDAGAYESIEFPQG
ncbi:MAG TPA: right-handed parallel beta-helix repeat-containing protein [Aequorivita sp.]|nr:right-handed parallel beta-helix repeat-containing protein [Aequorivita sp.]